MWLDDSELRLAIAADDPAVVLNALDELGARFSVAEETCVPTPQPTLLEAVGAAVSEEQIDAVLRVLLHAPCFGEEVSSAERLGLALAFVHHREEAQRALALEARVARDPVWMTQELVTQLVQRGEGSVDSFSALVEGLLNGQETVRSTAVAVLRGAAPSWRALLHSLLSPAERQLYAVAEA